METAMRNITFWVLAGLLVILLGGCPTGDSGGGDDDHVQVDDTADDTGDDTGDDADDDDHWDDTDDDDSGTTTTTQPGTTTTTTTTIPVCVDNGDGTVTCAAMGLMWSKYDNDHFDGWLGNISHYTAVDFVDHMTLAGHTDWRLPTRAELLDLYDENYTYLVDCTTAEVHIIPPLIISCYLVWSSELHSPSEAYFIEFVGGSEDYGLRSATIGLRALPVRDLP